MNSFHNIQKIYIFFVQTIFSIDAFEAKMGITFLNSIFSEIIRNISDKMKINRNFEMINRNWISISNQL